MPTPSPGAARPCSPTVCSHSPAVTALTPPGYANTVIGSVNTREPSGQFPRASTPTLPVLTRIYGPEALAKHNYSTIVNSTGFAGTLVGMLFFGKSPPPSTCSTHPSRFFLGIGVGAEYPCGSVAASEQSEEPAISYHARHRWLGLATSKQPPPPTTTLPTPPPVTTLPQTHPTQPDLMPSNSFGPDHLRAVWRLSLGLGIVPALIVLLWRLNMDEPMRYKSDSMKNTRIPYALVLQRYWPSLLAISVI
ncbi:hypothetical protein C0989_000844, partial [Termitomyces sp. Mn162]